MSNLIYHNGELWHTEDLSDDVLMHYGVVGMKWGKRRAAAKGKNYQYSSINTRVAQRSLNRATKSGDETRIKAAKKRVNAHKRLDKKRQQMLEGRSKKQVRNSYALTALGTAATGGGGIGVRVAQNSYRAARAEGNGRLRSAAVGSVGIPGRIINRELNVRR